MSFSDAELYAIAQQELAAESSGGISDAEAFQIAQQELAAESQPSWTDVALGSLGRIAPSFMRGEGGLMKLAGDYSHLTKALPIVGPIIGGLEQAKQDYGTPSLSDIGQTAVNQGNALDQSLVDQYNLGQVDPLSAKGIVGNTVTTVGDLVSKIAMSGGNPLALAGIFGADTLGQRYPEMQEKLTEQGITGPEANNQALLAATPSAATSAAVGLMPVSSLIKPLKSEAASLSMEMLKRAGIGAAEFPLLATGQRLVDEIGNRAVNNPTENLGQELVTGAIQAVPAGMLLGGGGAAYGRARQRAAEAKFRKGVEDLEAKLLASDEAAPTTPPPTVEQPGRDMIAEAKAPIEAPVEQPVRDIVAEAKVAAPEQIQPAIDPLAPVKEQVASMLVPQAETAPAPPVVSPLAESRATRSLFNQGLGERGAVAVPEVVSKAADAVRGVFDSERGLEKASPSERYGKGKDGLPIVPRSIKKATREGLASNRYLAQKFLEANPAYQGHFKSIGDAVEKEVSFREQLFPYTDLPVQDRAPVDQALIAHRNATAARVYEGKAPVVMTDERLATMGLNPNQIKAFRTIRNFFDGPALESMQNALLADLPKVPEAKQPEYQQAVMDYIDSLRGMNYVPSSRLGQDYEVRATLKNGKVYVKFFDKPKEARRDAARLRNEGAEVQRAGERTVIPDESFRALPPGLLDHISEFNPDKWTKMAETGRQMKGFKGHLVKRTGVEGYETDLLAPTLSYAKGLANFEARKVNELPIRDAIEAIPDGWLKTKVKKNYEASFREQGDVERGLLKFMSLRTLAGVPSTGVFNLTQSFTNTLPFMVKEYGVVKGGAKFAADGAKTLGYVLGTTLEKAKFVRAHPDLAKFIDDAVLKTMPEETKLVLDKLRRRGELGFKLNTNVPQRAKADLREFSPSDIMMLTFTVPEYLNRALAAKAFFDIAQKRGYGPEQAASFTSDMIRETQHDQSPANILPFKQNALGSVGGQYRDYQVHQLRFLKKYLTKGELAVAGTSLAVTALLSGVVYGIPGSRDTMALLEAAGYNPRLWLRRYLGGDEATQDAILYGAGAGFGVPLAGIGTGQVVPSLDKDPLTTVGRIVAGPTGAAVTDAVKVGKAIKQREYYQAAEFAAPRGARGPMKALRAAYQGNLSDIYGQPQIEKPTAGNLAALATGFTPMPLARYYEQQQAAYNAANEGKGDSALFANLIAKAQVAGDTQAVKDLVAEAQAKGIPIRRQSIKDNVLKIRNPDAYKIKKAPKRNRAEVRDILSNE